MEKFDFLDKFHFIGSSLFNNDGYKFYNEYISAGSNVLCVYPQLLINDVFKNREKTVDIVVNALINLNNIVINSRADVDLALILNPPHYEISHNFDDIYDIYADVAVAAENNGVDLIILNNFCNIFDVKAALIAIKENASLPVAVILPKGEDLKNLSEAMAVCVSSAGANLIGVCSSGDVLDLKNILINIRKFTSIPLILYIDFCSLNDLDFLDIKSEYFKQIEEVINEYGIVGIGECGSTNANYIKCMSENISVDISGSYPGGEFSCITTSDSAFLMNEFNIVGIPSNINNNIDPSELAVLEAKRLLKEGANIFCISTKVLGINSEYEMTNVIHVFQKNVNMPVIIDTDDILLAEAALWAYEGKPGIYINCKDISQGADFIELVHRFGAALFVSSEEDDNPNECLKVKFKKKYYTSGMIIDILRLKKRWWYRDILIGTSINSKNSIDELKYILAILKRVNLNLNCTSFCNCKNVFGNSEYMNDICISFVTQALDRGCKTFFAESGLDCIKKAINLYNEIYKN